MSTSTARMIVPLLETCPHLKRIELIAPRPCVLLLEVETVQGTTLPLPGIDLQPRVEEIDRFTPWLDRKIRRQEHGFHGTLPKSHRMKRDIHFCDEIVTLHLCMPPRQWGIMAAVLTSPERFRKRLTSSREYGGLLPRGWRVQDEGVIVRSDGSPIIAPEENDFFAALSLPFVPRRLRK